MSFTALGLSSRFTGSFAARGIDVPTGIQTRIIPRLLAGESAVFSSATGTGKTFAYLLPLFERLLASGRAAVGPDRARGGPRLLVLAPTFELCSQIKAEADFLLGIDREGGRAESAAPDASSGHFPAFPPSFRVSLVIGGANMSRQIDALKAEKPAVIIGNPGRVLALVRLGKLKTRSLEALVLDEADRLAADELFEETAELLRFIQAGRSAPLQIAACSATMPPKSRERLFSVTGELPGMGEAGIDGAEEDVLRNKIHHWAIWSESREKIDTLRSFFVAAKPRKVLVFTARGDDVGKIAARLQYHHVAAGGLHGKMEKTSRRAALEDFRRGRLMALVTSDLAARGLDISGISHVIALDVPGEADAYLHRAGRTARAGKEGVMVTIGDAEEMRALAKLEKKLGIVIYPKELYQGTIAAPEVE
jgi:superfamily II DNA/RNA helicase